MGRTCKIIPKPDFHLSEPPKVSELFLILLFLPGTIHPALPSTKQPPILWVWTVCVTRAGRSCPAECGTPRQFFPGQQLSVCPRDEGGPSGYLEWVP